MAIYIVSKSQMATENPVSFQNEEIQTSKMRKQASPRSLRGLCTLFAAVRSGFAVATPRRHLILIFDDALYTKPT